MTQPFGFVPPVALPAIGGAANAIIPTAGILGGVAAGARAGAVLGPKGAAIGGILGGLLLPLLFPPPTAPGTIPGLDPGLEPQAQPGGPLPDLPATLIPPPGGDLTRSYQWLVKIYENRHGLISRFECGSNIPISDDPATDGIARNVVTYGAQLEVEFISNTASRVCGAGPPQFMTTTVIKAIAVNGDKTVAYTAENVTGTFSAGTFAWTAPASFEHGLLEIRADEQGVPLPERKPLPLPRPYPVIPKPLAPPAIPEPGPVPQPEPEPQPLPLEVPSPDRPNAPPITIPKAPPAEPQTVPVPGPQTPPSPEPRPLPLPIEPGTVPIPQPIPGVPTIPEPSPDPNVVPAPAPTPLPAPGPTPVPGPAPVPEPGETPTPGTPITPRPTIPGVAPAPDTSRPTLPDGSIVPQPQPQPVPTPPNVHFPVPGAPPVTDGGVRPTLPAIGAEVGRIEQKVARLQNGQGFPDLGNLLQLLPLLLEFLEGDIPGTTYQLQGVCEDVGEGEGQPVSQFPVASAKNLGAVINRLDTIDEMLQQHLAWKTPTCSRRPVLAGDWRTITFISDESSGTRGDRLRKRFRYRSTSGLGLPGVIDHWANFTWQAGPVCVQHAGSTWGTPQVWASSINEGKRVIRHAAGEAGIDPDQNGRWVISGSDSPRVGLPGTMRVNKKGGYYWITARDGPDGSPIIGTTP